MDMPGRKKKGEKETPLLKDRAIVVQLDGRKKGGGGTGGGAGGGKGKGRDGRGGTARDDIAQALRALAASPPDAEGGTADDGSVILFHEVEASLEKIKAYDEADVQRRTWEPFVEGTRWECMKCGRCCRENWRVNLTWEEHDRLGDRLDVRHVVVDEATDMSHPVMIIDGRCRALDPERNTCTIYRKRAYSCATFPFSLTTQGELHISRFCEGFGKGPVVDEQGMVRYILKWRKRAGMSKEHLRRKKGRE